ncbi:ATP-binding cassette domain-containing protein [Actinotalea sp. M2MS4P-6]|uniref:oligopeptide/dipeptide ABC transporter ATP-binding protein n=1 Tax=Actinotalea sp. M2MS4P-6 TaxID=2983762 RepID=UPI0021E481F9|nr:oligopeptide/dipeptide ABC transporter ATP-binding protein [Actinotalea sp. M2MS4P-6]MCV2394387.1 ATP-binding cassette domain-containing protein [Actinotalea sp. M2MS4P-6]
METETLLKVEDLRVEYPGTGWRSAPFRAVDGVSFEIRRGETVGLVGESGSGKSTIGRAVLGLLEPAGGRIEFGGHDVTHRDRATQRQVSRRLQAIFQDPYSSLNPARTVGRTMVEPLEVQGGAARAGAVEKVASLLADVGLPEDSTDRYPPSFSGGQRQRIAIARSLSISPQLIICDEAVSALDLVTRAQVLNLLGDLQRERGFAYLFIAHDLPIVTYVSQRTVVLYRGRIMEQGPARAVHESPLHPYTQMLLAAVPVPDPAVQRVRRARRRATAVSTGTAAQPPAEGCPFAPRCPKVMSRCWTQRPEAVPVGEQVVECHLFGPSNRPAWVPSPVVRP